MNEYIIAKNISLKSAEKISYKREGILLPKLLSLILKKKYIKLQNKFNRFIVATPVNHIAGNSILIERLKFFSEMKKYNTEYLPNFTTLTTGITAKLI